MLYFVISVIFFQFASLCLKKTNNKHKMLLYLMRSFFSFIVDDRSFFTRLLHQAESIINLFSSKYFENTLSYFYKFKFIFTFKFILVIFLLIDKKRIWLPVKIF